MTGVWLDVKAGTVVVVEVEVVEFAVVTVVTLSVVLVAFLPCCAAFDSGDAVQPDTSATPANATTARVVVFEVG